MTSNDMSKLLTVNKLKYQLPSNLNIVERRQNKVSFADQNTYLSQAGSEVVIRFTASTDYVYGPNSFLTFNVKTELKDIEILGISNELVQVIINIIKNSKDAFVSNSILIREISIKTKKYQGYAFIELQDNAGGISKENLELITEHIKSYDYRIFMINEILPGNALDCRNFLALPREKGLPSLKKFEQSNGRDIDIYSATIGPAIIEI